MPQKSLDKLTEPMFYVLMAFVHSSMCGTEVADFVFQRSSGEVKIGPATLYTILSKFEAVSYIKEIDVDGRKRTYEITDRGRVAYAEEIIRIKRMIRDAEKGEII